jgi:magnesium transporter
VIHNGPVIVDCALFRDGKRAAPVEDLSDALAEARAAGGSAFVWIGLHEPSADEFDHVADELRLHPLAVEDAVKAHQQPKVEDYDESMFVVLKTTLYDDTTSSISIGEVMLFLGDSFVVTVGHGDTRALVDVRQRLATQPKLLEDGPSAVLYAVADRIVDGYTEVALELEQDIDDVEEAVFSRADGTDAERIYKLKREVIEFRRTVRPLMDPMERLSRVSVPNIPKAIQPYLRDVADHIAKVVDLIENFDDLLASALNANLTQVSVRQNNDMRRISAWVAIVAVPTLIAGIYGMNFRYMPELNWRLGYPMALTLMATICLTLYRAFKRSGWL